MPSQSRVWAETIVQGSGSRDASRHYMFFDGQEIILPLFRRNVVPFALSLLRSPPANWGFGGALTTAPLTEKHAEAVLEECAETSAGAVSIRPNPLHAAPWLKAAATRGWTSVPKLSHILSLEGGFETVRTSRFSGNTRSKIRRAEKQGVSVEIGNTETLLAGFDSLFRRSIDRWARRQKEFAWLAQFRGRLRDSSRKFRAMAKHAGEVFQVAIASQNGRPIAGSIVLLDRNAHYTRGAMDDRLIGRTYANYLLHAKIIELACDRNCGHYHMGETGSSSSLAQFKGHFGALAVPYAELWYERLPIMSADRTMRSGIKRLIGFSDV
ncbi:MAG: GNAT family N-acetyltransferase [Roseibium sp.]|uniref:GNAT family N-acetyltransferase n=1 Tax=Roseibium sp. TaxID=1936156 RepID=UPI0026057373|nr:GNAT family N-acetyltransferase [Roseibium sp.]MCV0426184.1 GNAT family N-acetyltransferase [Roseibium sp.]